MIPATLLLGGLLAGALQIGALLIAPTARAQREVELVEPGRAPRQPLRHRFEAGQRRTLQVRIQSRMHVETAEREQSIVVPAIMLQLSLGPTEVTSEGNVRYPFRIAGLEAAGGDAQARAQIQEQLASLVGTRGSAEVDARGGSVRLDYELPASVPDEIRPQAESLRGTLAELLPRLPEEPVGIGAVWRIRDVLRMPQISVQMATVYTLRRREGDRVEMDVRIEASEGQDLPESMQLNVTGTGRQRFALGGLAVRSRVQTDADMQVTTPQGPVQIFMQTRTEMRPAERHEDEGTTDRSGRGE